MKKIAFCLGLFIFSAMSYSLSAQNIVEAEENENELEERQGSELLTVSPSPSVSNPNYNQYTDFQAFLYCIII